MCVYTQKNTHTTVNQVRACSRCGLQSIFKDLGAERHSIHSDIHYDSIGFEVLTVVSMKMALFWVVAPCSLVEVYQRPDNGGSKL
jgi:hypothetical protein